MSSLDRVSHSAQWTRKKTPICDYPRLIAFGFSTPRSVYSTAYFLRKLGIVRRHLQSTAFPATERTARVMVWSSGQRSKAAAN